VRGRGVVVVGVGRVAVDQEIAQGAVEEIVRVVVADRVVVVAGRGQGVDRSDRVAEGVLLVGHSKIIADASVEVKAIGAKSSSEFKGVCGGRCRARMLACRPPVARFSRP
jgi:hypothetical protein